MKKLLTLTLALGLGISAYAQEESVTENVTMREGTFWPNHEVAGQVYINGGWINYPWASSQEMIDSVLLWEIPDSQSGWDFAFNLADSQYPSSDMATAWGYDSTSALQSDLESWGMGPQDLADYFGITPPYVSNDDIYTDSALKMALLASLDAFPKEELPNLEMRTGGMVLMEIFNTKDEAIDLVGAFRALQIDNPDDPYTTLALVASIWEIYSINSNAKFADQIVGNEIDFTGLNLAGGALFTTDLSNTNISVAQLNSLAYSGLWGSNLSGMNLTGIDFSEIWLEGTNLTGVTGVTTEQIFASPNIEFINLTGWNFPSAPTQTEVNRLSYANLNNVTGIPISLINGRSGIAGMSFQGWDLSGLTTTSKSLNSVDVRNTNITAAQLNTATNYGWMKADATNLSGFNPTGKSMNGATFTGITTPQQFVTATGITPGPGTIWIDGTRPWGN